MLEESEFAELYRNLVDQHFKPDSQRAATALQGVLRQLSGGGSNRSGP